ncbi:helix-turn-helix domain-containing protein [Pediococcus pentosaceus]|uniref:helix-turn-helix domain-containing protein n=1 Tax=Pediococcus pentosaceus TaxID=1255 RepID=UPI0020172CF7|nr:helix-turn-helix domain-containing protein [Pediococcus pentosaceus]MCL3857903.1 helix-turn-helix domain-containing protein [Pediococcus pentosaceus]
MAAISLDGIDEKVADRVVELIIPKIEERINKTLKTDKLMTQDEVMEKLHVGYELFKRDYYPTMPHIGHGRGIRYSEKSIDKWIEENQETLI